MAPHADLSDWATWVGAQLLRPQMAALELPLDWQLVSAELE
jgi:hypothetical protein